MHLHVIRLRWWSACLLIQDPDMQFAADPYLCAFDCKMTVMTVTVGCSARQLVLQQLKKMLSIEVQTY